MSKYAYESDYERELTEKYEGVFTDEEAALNRRLYEECLKEEIDFSLIEELLKQGADPLGGTAACGWDVLIHVYGELVLEYGISNSPNLIPVTELFLKNRMVMSAPRIPYDDYNDSFHPLKYLGLNEHSIIALQMLLDNGATADDVAEFWSHFIFNEYNVHHENPHDEEWHDYFVWFIRMLILIASYDHVLNNDEDLRRIIGVSYNTYDIHNFKNWNNYYFEFDTSRCEKYPELYGCVVRVYDVENNNEVWKIGFHVPEGSF